MPKHPENVLFVVVCFGFLKFIFILFVFIMGISPVASKGLQQLLVTVWPGQPGSPGWFCATTLSYYCKC